MRWAFFFVIIKMMLEKLTPTNRIQISDLLASQTDLGPFQIVKVIKNRQVKVNNVRIGNDCYVDANDVVYVYIKDREKDNIEIVFEDKNILVAVKPTGIEVEGEKSFTQKLNEQIDDPEKKVTPVHRLDRNTMGLVLFALNQNAEKELLRVFKQREIDKNYYAIVSGNPRKSAELKAYMFKDAKKSLSIVSATQKPGYQSIETHYKFIKRKGELSLLDVKLITGRTHQIRAHLAFEKLPIVGDGKYGYNSINRRYKVKTQLLCCYKITLHFGKDSSLSYLDNKSIKYDIDLFDLVSFS